MSNLHGMFDTFVIIWIALVDSVALYFVWRSAQQKEKDRIRRKVSKLLKSLGLVHGTQGN